jgi:molybdate transport system substrate-binding protein
MRPMALRSLSGGSRLRLRLYSAMHIGLMARLLPLLLSLLLLLGLGQPAAAHAPVTIFAAASLRDALDQAAADYARSTANPPLRISYASSSMLARQIEQGAPADLFIAADREWMDYLAGKGLIQAGTRTDLFTNHLALIAPKGSPARLDIQPGFPLARALGGGRLAMAGPEVPAGKYGQASLQALGVWDQVKDHTARGDNVRAALQFVARGEAPFGIVYDTDALTEPGVRIVGLFPDSSHPPIVYPAAAVTANPEAQAFLAWLKGPRAAAIFTRFGFRPAK